MAQVISGMDYKDRKFALIVQYSVYIPQGVETSEETEVVVTTTSDEINSTEIMLHCKTILFYPSVLQYCLVKNNETTVKQLLTWI